MVTQVNLSIPSMSIEDFKQIKKQHKLSWQQIADLTGYSYDTLTNLASTARQQTKKARRETERLQKALGMLSLLLNNE